MDVTEAIRGRRSIRRFKTDPVSREDIEKMIYAASMAPSGGNVQPWHFLAIVNAHYRDEMARIIHDEGVAFFRDSSKGVPIKNILPSLVFSRAPLVFVVLVRFRSLEDDPFFSTFQREHHIRDRDIDRYGGFIEIQSTAAAIENLLIAAYDLGYGSCWLRVPFYAKDHLERFLNVEKPWEILALVPVGVPDQTPSLPSRRPVEEILTYIN